MCCVGRQWPCNSISPPTLYNNKLLGPLSESEEAIRQACDEPALLNNTFENMHLAVAREEILKSQGSLWAATPRALSDYQKGSCELQNYYRLLLYMADWLIITAGMGAKWTYKHGLIDEKNRCDEKVSGNSYCVLIINYKLNVDIFWRNIICQHMEFAFKSKQPIYTSMILWCREFYVAGWLMRFWVRYRCPKSKRPLPFSKSLGLLCN